MLVLSHRPHRRTGRGPAAEPLAAALGLAPLVLAAAALWPARFPLALAAAAAAGLGAGLALGRGRISRPAAAWGLYEALVICLMMPEGAPWHAPALMAAAAAGLRLLAADRDFWPPVNTAAAVLGVAMLSAAPGALAMAPAAQPLVGRGGFHFMSGWLPLALAAALTAALRLRTVKRAMAGWFLLSAGLAAAVWSHFAGLWGEPGWAWPAAAAAVFAAAAFLTDPRATPRSAAGQAGAGSIAGVVFALFALRGMSWQGMVAAALAANLVTPLFDHLLARSRPR